MTPLERDRTEAARGRRINAKVLVTDDDKAQRMILRRSLDREGYQVFEAENGLDAVARLADDPDIRLLITDLAMPRMDGYDLIKSIREKELRYVYVIVLTSIDDRGSLLRALSLGADDYLTKPVFPDELKLRMRSGSRLLKLEGHEELIFSMAKLAEYRSEETGFHLERVYHYNRILSRRLSRNHPELSLSIGMADEIAIVSALHDIGKVAIPDHILHKPGKLTRDEFEVMKSHTAIGGKLIREIHAKTGSSYLRVAYETAMHHHERWDGAGYPAGLKGEEIPLSARIMALSDVYDAMTSRRSYKAPFSHETARNLIVEGKGRQFDPKIVDAFLSQEDRWLAVKKRFQDEPEAAPEAPGAQRI